MGVSGDPRRRLVGTGIKVEAVSRHHRELTDPGEGRHLWAVVAMFTVRDPATLKRIDMDMENLATIEGPACFKCEEPYSPALSARPCTGSMS